MIITIEGKFGEGKTTVAKNIYKWSKVSFIEENSLKSSFWSWQVDADTKFIVVDDVANYEETYSFFTQEFLEINMPFTRPFYIKMPDVILILKP